MSFRSPPPQHTESAQLSPSSRLNRQRSDVSSTVSSTYSTTSSVRYPPGRTSTVSSAATYLSQSENRPYGTSDFEKMGSVLERAKAIQQDQNDQVTSPPRNSRTSLRPLAQAPTALPLHPQLDKIKSGKHNRGQSLDTTRSAQLDGSTSATPVVRPSTKRPTSMLLSRADSVSTSSTGTRSTQHHFHAHTNIHTPISTPDLLSLQKSTTSHLRTLSKFAENASPEEFAITAPVQEVVGLHGRRKLQRSANSVTSHGSSALSVGGGYGWEGRNWMDKQRQFLQAYEYLCHIGEAKEWIEDIIHKPIPAIIELEEGLRDGVTLAEIVESLHPEKKFRIFRSPKLQYRHSDNINIFFQFLNEIELPELFRFEFIDLYDKKNIPKVIYCIHALSWLLFRQGVVDFRIGNLVGQLQFEDHELEATQKGLDKTGVSMPSFGNMGADFGIEPEVPVESDEDRIARELKEREQSIVELQTQIRGAIMRIALGQKMQRLWDAELLLIDLQSRVRGDNARQISGYHLSMKKFATSLQSAARGFLERKRQQSTEVFWSSRQADVLKLQSAIRGKQARNQFQTLRKQSQRKERAYIGFQASVRGFLARGQVERNMSQLQTQESGIMDMQALMRGFISRQHIAENRHRFQNVDTPITQLQSTIRGFLQRNCVAAQRTETRHAATPTKNLQAAIRGMAVRKSLTKNHHALLDEEQSIISLQALSRAAVARKELTTVKQSLSASAPIWRALQAVSRGSLQRNRITASLTSLRTHEDSIRNLQKMIRAGAVRIDIANTLDALRTDESSILDFQNMARGMLTRQKIADQLDVLDTEGPQIIRLQAAIRGCQTRSLADQLRQDLLQHSSIIVELQSLSRAMLLRDDVAGLLEGLEAEEASTVELQSAARAYLVRARFAEKQRFFKANMEKVIKLQSFVRGKIQGEAYKNLTTGKNPPVNTVKNFVHLLNDNDFDFNEEIEFESLRKGVVQQIRQNEMAEEYIAQLDIKIALLVKNKITLDDVMQHQRNFGHNSSAFTTSTIAAGGHFDLRGLTKNSRKKLESYQQLFFTLQTQPQYLARLFKRVREQGTSENECKRIETLMMGLFGYAQKRREEYYLLKLICRAIKEEIDSCNSIQDYLRGNFFWTKLLNNYTRSPRDRKYLREILGPLIKDNIIDDPALDLESDPIQIYRSAISNEELRTGQPSRRPLDIPRDIAIKDTETRTMFIDHLRDLREISDQFLVAFDELLHKMPYGVRFVAQQIFQGLCDQFPRETQEDLLVVVGNWVWRFYLQPALVNPEHVGVTDKQLTPLQKRNLGEVAKVLGQIASGKLFGGDNIYLQPLNAYVGDGIDRITGIYSNLISVPDAESTFDIDEFNDLYAKTKPTLYIKMTDIFAIHKLVATDLALICPNRDDMLREIVHELGSASSNESELSGVTTAEIQLTLNPKLHDIEDPEAEIKALFMETKRCVLYIIRIQSGSNLLEILILPITPVEEDKWQTLLDDEFANPDSRGAYADANSVDITSLTYAELKRTALENIMRLESLGRISRHNYYQDLLNAIALDIRTKSRRRVQRQRELEGVRLTIGNLKEKERWLESQRKSYDDYIEQAMMTLQNKKGKKRFLLPFTKQYNHERELEKSGRRPKFGSFKYSARTLADKGVLVSWQGYPDSKWDKINITLSCDEVGVFNVEGSMGNVAISGASASIPLEVVLEAQFAASTFLTIFEGGVLRLNVNLFLHLIYRKFYRSD